MKIANITKPFLLCAMLIALLGGSFTLMLGQAEGTAQAAIDSHSLIEESEEIEAAKAAGVPIELVPGVTSASAVASALDRVLATDVAGADATQAVAAAAATVINAELGAATVVAFENTINTTGNSTVAASSTDTFAIMLSSDIISQPQIDYVSRNPTSTGTLRYTPVGNAFGVVAVTVTTEDAGVDGIFEDDPNTILVDESLDNLAITRTFTITVNPINDDPTMDQIDGSTVAAGTETDEDATQQTVPLTGITAGPINELEDIRLTSTLHATTTVAIAIGANVIGETLTIDGMVFTFVDADVVTSPTAMEIAVSQTDSTFEVAVQSAAVINAALGTDTAIASSNTVNVASSTVTSSSTEAFALMTAAEVITIDGINYVSRNLAGEGELLYKPVGNAFGVVTVTIRTEDAGIDGLFDTAADNNFIDRTFTVTINPINDDPTLAAIADITIDEDPDVDGNNLNDEQSFTLTANDQDGVGSNLSTVDASSVTSDVVATTLVFNTQPVPLSVNSGEATNFTT